MGKSKNKKRKNRTACPTGLPSVRDIEQEEEEFLQSGDSHRASTIEAVTEKLQSASVDDRECAAYSIANLVNQPDVVQSLLDEKVVRMAAPLLVDPSNTVRHSISGALRNLSAVNHEACNVMLDQDIMTPLTVLLKQFATEWSPAASGSKIDTKSEIFKEAVNLLWNLCESGERPISIFTRDNLHTILYPCLDANKYGGSISIAVAHCLHTVTEDNSDLAEKLDDLRLLNSLLELKCSKPSELLLKVLAAGILLNMEHCKSLTGPLSFAAKISAVDEALTAQVLPGIQNISGIITDIKKYRMNKHKILSDMDEKEAEIELLYEDIEYILTAKQTALEILANLCCSEDNENADDDSSDTSEEIYDVSMDGEDIPVAYPLNVPCEVHEAIISRNLVCRVMEHMTTLDEKIVSTLQDHKLASGLLKKVHMVRCRALFCIDNLAQALNPDDLGGASGLVSTWTCLAQLAFMHVDVKDVELLEASTSASRAVLQSVARAKELRPDCPLPQVSCEEIKVMGNLCLLCSEPSVRVNICRIMGTLGCLLNTQNEIVKVIGQFLLDVCSKDSEIIVVAEALDAVFDVFAEDDTDALTSEISLVSKLRQVLPMFKGKIGQCKASLGKHYPVVMTAKTNLIRFIKYKSKQGVKNGTAS